MRPMAMCPMIMEMGTPISAPMPTPIRDIPGIIPRVVPTIPPGTIPTIIPTRIPSIVPRRINININVHIPPVCIIIISVISIAHIKINFICPCYGEFAGRMEADDAFTVFKV